MKQNGSRQTGGVFSELIGAPTPSKNAGLMYTVAACAIFFVSFLVGTIAPQEEKPEWLLYVNFLAAPLAFLLTAAWYFFSTKSSVRTFAKEQNCHLKYYLLAIVLQIGLLSLSELNGLFLKLLNRFGYQETPIELPSMDGFGFVGVLLTVAVLPAFTEELLFRGIFLRETKEFSTLPRALLCGALFALYHQNPAQTIYQFICGSAFAYIAIRAGSFLPTVISHLVNNALIVTLYKYGITSFEPPMYAIILIVSGVCLAGTIVYFLFFDKEKRSVKTTRKGAYKELFACASVGIALLALSWIATLLVGF